jgi:hypothetical protein
MAAPGPVIRNIGEYQFWFGWPGRNEQLKGSRQRFIISVQAMLYALNKVFKTQMPDPEF